MWWDNLCYSNINGTQRGPFEEQICKEFPVRKTNCLTFRKEMRALKRRTSTSSKISYHQRDKWSLSKSLLWWPSPCRMLTDSCSSWWAFSTLLPEVSITTTLGHHLHASWDLPVPTPSPWPSTTAYLYQASPSEIKQKVTHRLLFSSGDPTSLCLLQPPLCF